MQRGVILILSLFEGRDWYPLDKHSAVLVARLSSHILSSDLIPLTSCPKFNTDFSWSTDRQTIRSFKLNRVPIKLECYSVNDSKQKSHLGYVIIPLTSAVEGAKGDAKWYKILGGSSIPHKDPPSLLLSLSLEAMTLDQQKQKSDKLSSSMKGQLYLEHANIFPIDVIKMKDSVAHNNTNGNSVVVQKRMMGSHDHSFVKSSNGVSVKVDSMVDLEEDGSVKEEGNEISEVDNEEGEDLYNFDSDEEYSDGDINYSSDNDEIIEGYSLVNKIKNKNSQHDEKYSVTMNLCHNVESVEKKELKVSTLKENDTDNISDLTNVFSEAGSPNFNHEISKRAAVKESLQSSLKHTSLLSPDLSSQQSSFSKRTLEALESLDEPKQKFKKSKLNSTRSSYKGLFGNYKSQALLDIKNNPEATSTAILLSESLNRTSSPTHISLETENISANNNTLKERLNATLNESEGYFQIGQASAKDVNFIYSVTIIYAEYLSQVVSIDPASSEHRNFHFQYSLLDFPITTDSFMNLDDPEFMSEKATASIRCTTENLSEYFNQHSILSIQLVSNEKCFALCSIDIKSLVTIIDKERILIEGPFDIYGVEFPSCSNDMRSKCNAKIGVSIELSLNNAAIGEGFSNRFLEQEISNLKNENLLKMPGDDSVDSSSKASDSELDCKCALGNKRKSSVRSGKRFGSFSKHYSENCEEKYHLRNGNVADYQITLMNKAKKEVKDWKIERRKCFEKELDIYARSLQEKITSECQRQLKEMENDLIYRLKECDLLKEQLSSSLNDLILREKVLHSREGKVAKLQKEILDEKSKQLLPADDKISSKNEYGIRQVEEGQDIRDSKMSQLEFQNCRLQEEYVRSESTIRELTLENIDLKRKLIESENFISIVKDKDILTKRVETLQERKQYYKEQWMKAISEMLSSRTPNKKFVNRIKSGSLRNNQIEIEPEKYNEHSLSSHVGYKLKKLKEERKVLMEGGLYTSDHAIIKNIDYKIRKLVLGPS